MIAGQHKSEEKEYTEPRSNGCARRMQPMMLKSKQNENKNNLYQHNNSKVFRWNGRP